MPQPAFLMPTSAASMLTPEMATETAMAMAMATATATATETETAMATQKVRMTVTTLWEFRRPTMTPPASQPTLVLTMRRSLLKMLQPSIPPLIIQSMFK